MCKFWMRALEHYGTMYTITLVCVSQSYIRTIQLEPASSTIMELCPGANTFAFARRIDESPFALFAPNLVKLAVGLRDRATITAYEAVGPQQLSPLVNRLNLYAAVS